MVEPRPTTGDADWFIQSRFGLFIHWGVYALPARHEWIKKYESIPDQAYDRYLRYFDPDLFDPQRWAQTAAQAGMKYVVITTKHHDGFCLWDSKLTSYKATKTPAGRDLLRPLVEAFRQQGLRIGFYHSLIDWHHPQFVIDVNHPRYADPDRDQFNAGRDQQKYVEYLHGQVEELLTGFGQIDLMFFDFSYPTGKNPRTLDSPGKGRDDWQSEKLMKMVRRLQPQLLLNDRMDLTDQPDGWDYTTPEQFLPRQGIFAAGQPVLWETCQTFSGSWGYHRDQADWKSVPQLIRMLIAVVSKGGNLLLNVGPTARGEFDERATDRLTGIARWMKRHSRSIYNCARAPERFPTPQDCRLTYNSQTKRLYLHVFAWPFKHLHLDGLAGQVEYVQLLHDASEIKMIEHDESVLHTSLSEPNPPSLLTLELPVRKPPVSVPVIELFLK